MNEPRWVTIDDYINGLAEIPEKDFVREVINPYIANCRLRHETLAPYAFFSPATYTRNLIFKNDLFEIIAICWEAGQISRIHNHRDQQCFMAMAMGRLENQNYKVTDKDPEKGTCKLEYSERSIIFPTSHVEVDPVEPVHHVGNLEEFSERAISIHMYSRPFMSCEVYSFENGTYCDVDLYYTTEFGEPGPECEKCQAELVSLS